ncbi:uncharacterized protein LOC131929496 [Physella acuta]|uniref:uncharacterized protein LOC131929496 n=1 Tax=Physella acuta TaxID=109671 RepID=UPI0027DB0FBA|nr:uncharacterized protein LOC131929496 [Physella acuta]
MSKRRLQKETGEYSLIRIITLIQRKPEISGILQIRTILSFFSLLNSSSPLRVDNAGVDNALNVKLKQPSLRAIHKRLVDYIRQSTPTKDRNHYVSKRSLDEVSDSSTSDAFSGENGLEKQRDPPYNEMVDNNEEGRNDKNNKGWFAGNGAGTQPEDLELMLDDGFMLVPLEVLEANLQEDRQPAEDMEDKASPYGGRLDGWGDRSVDDMISMLKRDEHTEYLEKLQKNNKAKNKPRKHGGNKETKKEEGTVKQALTTLTQSASLRPGCGEDRRGYPMLECSSDPNICVKDEEICDGVRQCPKGEDEAFRTCSIHHLMLHWFRKFEKLFQIGFAMRNPL